MIKPGDSEIKHLRASGLFVFGKANDSVFIVVDLSARRTFRCANLFPGYGETFTQKDGRLDFSGYDTDGLGDDLLWVGEGCGSCETSCQTACQAQCEAAREGADGGMGHSSEQL